MAGNTGKQEQSQTKKKTMKLNLSVTETGEQLEQWPIVGDFQRYSLWRC